MLPYTKFVTEKRTYINKRVQPSKSLTFNGFVANTLALINYLLCKCCEKSSITSLTRTFKGLDPIFYVSIHVFLQGISFVTFVIAKGAVKRLEPFMNCCDVVFQVATNGEFSWANSTLETFSLSMFG